jgi:hypothetical protein
MWLVAAIVVCAIAGGAAAWALIGASSPGQSDDRCVTVTMASTMGGGVEHACGSAARDWCQAASAQHDRHAEAVQTQCRVAGFLP